MVTFKLQDRRSIIIIISILAIVFLLLSYFNVIDKARKARPPSHNFDESELQEWDKMAFEIYRDWSASVAQITILLFGAIWGFVIQQKIKFNKDNLPIWIAFSVPNISFSLEYFLHGKVQSRFVEMLYSLKTIDMCKNSGYFYLLPEAQWRFFLYGIITSVIFILLTIKLKEDNHVFEKKD